LHTGIVRVYYLDETGIESGYYITDRPYLYITPKEAITKEVLFYPGLEWVIMGGFGMTICKRVIF
jgi:hypothetical protein